ncbi:hypothetical protein [Inhella proteolytica]|uniref:Uncharacterized protein n=1 Tax=Inhella proteolytica TaxID=2795029 RepID=A0A931NIE1_9BURK|nr:hypothetical protein [Inhella proteolytica]MBH9577475.1 hypothetical protein [Inhella proteolytica]
MTPEQARQAVLALAEQLAVQSEDGSGPPALPEAPPLERSWGWAFSLEWPTGPGQADDPEAGPRRLHVLIERATGRLSVGSPGRSLEEHLARFEAQAAQLLQLRRGPRGVSAPVLERELHVVFRCSPAEASALTQRCLRGETFALRLGPGADPERSRQRLESLGLEIVSPPSAEAAQPQDG